MEPINLNIALNLSDEEANVLANTLRCQVADLSQHLEPYAQAALKEYLEMLAGQAMISVTDLRERRLVSILVSLPDFPSDEKIARLFNLTSAQGRALLRTTLSRHRVRLKGAIEAAARRFIAACQGPPGKEQEARFPNAVIIDILNGQLATAAKPRAPIRRKPGTFDTYVVSAGAFIELGMLYP